MPTPFRRSRCLLVRLLAGAVLLWAGAASGMEPSAGRGELGFPLIETRIPGHDDAGVQNFGVAVGPDGLLYVANLGGLLVHDGAWWDLVPIGAGRTAFSVGFGGDGRVAVGGLDDFGYLERDERGRRHYVSLVGRLAEEDRGLGQILAIVPRDGGFLYLGTTRLVAWDGRERLEVLARFSPDPPFTFLFAVGDHVWSWDGDGLGRLEGPSLLELRIRPVPGGEAFRGRRIDQVLPADSAPAADALPGSGPPLLLSVRGEGLFLFRDGQVRPFAPRASRWAAESRVLAGLRLSDGRWVLGSILDGLLVLRPDGTVEQEIDTSVGLPDDLVYDFAEDREGGLWVALNSDLARIPVASPLSVLDRRIGIQGSVYTMVRHRGDLWVGTAEGLFRVRPEDAALGDAALDEGTPREATSALEGAPLPLRVDEVEGVPPSVWSLLSVGDDLLLATAQGVLVLRPPAAGEDRPGRPEPVPGLERGVAYVLAHSPSDPDRVWVAMSERLVSIRRSGGGRGGGWQAGAGVWRPDRVVDGAPGLVRSLVEKDGVLWCGTEMDGVVGVELPLPDDAPPRLRRIPSEDPISLFPVAGSIVAASLDRVLRLDEAAARLVEDPALASLDRHGDLYALVEDATGNLWLNTGPPSFVPVRRDADGRPRWDSGVLALPEIPARSVETFLAEADGTVWLAGSDGLYRHAGPPRGAGVAAASGGASGTSSPAASSAGVPGLAGPILARAIADGEELLFAGAPGQPPPSLDLASDLSRMRLDFAPLSFRPGLRYQVRLDPVDAGWGPPSDEPFTEITRLAPGRYTLRVRVLQPGYQPSAGEGGGPGPSPVGGGEGGEALAAAVGSKNAGPGSGPGSAGLESGGLGGAGLAGADLGSAGPGSVGLGLAGPGTVALAAGPSSAAASGARPGLAAVSPETAWSFRVLPPWYRTPGALLLWLGLGLLAFVGYGRYRSESLRRRAADLELQVRERTGELERAVGELRRTQEDLERANRSLKDLSLQDELTGIANRRRLQSELETEWRRARRHGRPLSFILVDLDHFKLLNDTRGHREGDRCLQAVARFLDERVRAGGPEGSLVVRYGGEEFAVLLPDVGLSEALEVAEDLRAGLEALDLPHEASPEGRITASLGVATTVPSPGERIETLVENADLALYRAKTDGRNLIRADGMEDDSGPHRPVPF